MLDLIALVACLTSEPRCAILKTYPTMEACQAVLAQMGSIPWAPLHCETLQIVSRK